MGLVGIIMCVGLVGIIMCVGLVGIIMCVGLIGSSMCVEFSRIFYVCGIQPDLPSIQNSNLPYTAITKHPSYLLTTSHAPISQHTYPKETTIRNSTQTTESLSTVRIAQ